MQYLRMSKAQALTTKTGCQPQSWGSRLKPPCSGQWGLQEGPWEGVGWLGSRRAWEGARRAASFLLTGTEEPQCWTKGMCVHMSVYQLQVSPISTVLLGSGNPSCCLLVMKLSPSASRWSLYYLQVQAAKQADGAQV